MRAPRLARNLFLAALAAVGLAAGPSAFAAATIVIANVDGPGVGFIDRAG